MPNPLMHDIAVLLEHRKLMSEEELLQKLRCLLDQIHQTNNEVNNRNAILRQPFSLIKNQDAEESVIDFNEVIDIHEHQGTLLMLAMMNKLDRSVIKCLLSFPYIALKQSYSSVLELAATHENTDYLDELFEKFPTVFAQCSNELCSALSAGRLRCAEYLLKHIPDNHSALSFHCNDGLNPAYYAAYHGFLGILKILHKKGAIIFNVNQHTALTIAIHHHHDECAKFLLSILPMNDPDFLQHNLQLAYGEVFMQDNAQIMHLLLMTGLKINIEAELSLAVDFMRFNIFQGLCEQNVDFNKMQHANLFEHDHLTLGHVLISKIYCNAHLNDLGEAILFQLLARGAKINLSSNVFGNYGNIERPFWRVLSDDWFMHKSKIAGLIRIFLAFYGDDYNLAYTIDGHPQIAEEILSKILSPQKYWPSMSVVIEPQFRKYILSSFAVQNVNNFNIGLACLLQLFNNAKNISIEEQRNKAIGEVKVYAESLEKKSGYDKKHFQQFTQPIFDAFFDILSTDSKKAFINYNLFAPKRSLRHYNNVIAHGQEMSVFDEKHEEIKHVKQNIQTNNSSDFVPQSRIKQEC